MTRKRLAEMVEDQGDRADITPLIDVIFMLLLFFIITTTFAEDTFFPISLPKGKGIELRSDQNSVILEVTKDGEFALERQPFYTHSDLFRALQAYKDEGRAQTAVLKVDAEAPSKHLIFVLDLLHALDIQEFAFTVEAEQ